MDNATYRRAVDIARQFQTSCLNEHNEIYDIAPVWMSQVLKHRPALEHNIDVLMDERTNRNAAYRALALVAAKLIVEGVPLPPRLATWARDAFARMALPNAKVFNPPIPKRRKGETLHAMRDILFCLTSQHVHRATGLQLGRSAASEAGGCVFDAVAEAWNVSYSTVRKAYYQAYPKEAPNK